MGDEVLFWKVARGIATGTDFPQLGPQISTGLARHPGPLLYYVMAVPLLVRDAPEACNAFVAVLGGVSVLLYWSALRPYFGETGAAMASLLMACMPWSTLYADRAWNPNVLGFFVALAFWAACRTRRIPSRAVVVLLVVSMAAMPHLHMSSPMVWLALLPIWLPSVRRWRWHWLLLAMTLALSLYAPMLIHERATHWSNVLAFVRESSAGSVDYRRVPLWAFRLLTLDVSYHQLTSYWTRHTEAEMVSFLLHGNSVFVYGHARRFLLVLSFEFAALAVGLAVWTAWGGTGKRWPKPFLWAALAGITANTALLLVTHKPIYGHYVQPLLPFYYVAFAELGRWSARHTRRRWATWALAVLVCVGGIDVARWVSRRLDARNGLSTVRAVIDAIDKDGPDPSFSLSFGFVGSRDAYQALIAQGPDHHKSLGPGPRYLLLLREAHAPIGARAVLETGPVTLYRMP